MLTGCFLDLFNAKPASAWVLAALGLPLLSACLPAATREDLRHNWDHTVADWNATDWHDVGYKLTGFDWSERPDWPWPSADEDRTLCLHHNSEERVLWEEGVSDQVNYRRCPVSPYPTRSLGERLSPGHIDPVELNNPLN